MQEVKISDFGMSDDRTIVHDDTLDKVPVKWGISLCRSEAQMAGARDLAGQDLLPQDRCLVLRHPGGDRGKQHGYRCGRSTRTAPSPTLV